jgi:hypothetical protein
MTDVKFNQKKLGSITLTSSRFSFRTTAYCIENTETSILHTAYRVSVGRPEGKRPLGRPRRRWENIKMNLQEAGGGMDWIDLAQDRDRWRALVNVVMNLRVP